MLIISLFSNIFKTSTYNFDKYYENKWIFKWEIKIILFDLIRIKTNYTWVWIRKNVCNSYTHNMSDSTMTTYNFIIRIYLFINI